MEVQRNKCGHILWTEELLNFIVENKSNISKASRELKIRCGTIF